MQESKCVVCFDLSLAAARNALSESEVCADRGPARNRRDGLARSMPLRLSGFAKPTAGAEVGRQSHDGRVRRSSASSDVCLVYLPYTAPWTLSLKSDGVHFFSRAARVSTKCPAPVCLRRLGGMPTAVRVGMFSNGVLAGSADYCEMPATTVVHRAGTRLWNGIIRRVAWASGAEERGGACPCGTRKSTRANKFAHGTPEKRPICRSNNGRTPALGRRFVSVGRQGYAHPSEGWVVNPITLDERRGRREQR